jgi:hypothetical protein
VGEPRVRSVRASYGAVHKLLTNPVDAGAFVLGLTRQKKHVDANDPKELLGAGERAAIAGPI